MNTSTAMTTENVIARLRYERRFLLREAEYLDERGEYESAEAIRQSAHSLDDFALSLEIAAIPEETEGPEMGAEVEDRRAA